MNIGIMDSGIGGITLFREIIKELPNYHYIYYGDSINNPYGNRSYDEVLNLSINVVKKLIKNDCKIIIIACNTISTMCINELRNIFKDTIFIGTFPPIKQAIDNNYSNILVMATTNTLKSEVVLDIIEENKKDNNIYLLACPNLAKMIEEKDVEIDNYLLKLLTNYVDKKIDVIILGCTHYPLIKDNIKKIITCDFLDSSYGIIKRLKVKINEANIKSKEKIIEINNSDISKIDLCIDLLNE